MTPQMLTITELAKRFKDGGLSEYRIRQMVLQGDVPYIKAGKKYLINFDLFVEYLNTPKMFEKIQLGTARKINER